MSKCEFAAQNKCGALKDGKDHMILLTWETQKKNGANELLSKTEIASQMSQTSGDQGGSEGDGTNWEFGIDIYTLLYLT